MRMAILAILAIALPAAQAQDDKANAAAKNVTEQFAKHFFARDLDGMMKIVDVPWCHDGVKNINDRDELRKEFAKLFARDRDMTKAKLHIQKIATLKEWRDAKQEPLKRKSSLEDVIGDHGRIALVTIENGDRKDNAWLGIRFDKDSAKIVGFVD